MRLDGSRLHVHVAFIHRTIFLAPESQLPMTTLFNVAFINPYQIRSIRNLHQGLQPCESGMSPLPAYR